MQDVMRDCRGEGASARCRRFWRDEAGVTAVEYGLIAAATGLAMTLLLVQTSTSLKDILTVLKDHLIAAQSIN